jgi:alkanesulfonate monooxygenase SsuD/methylene tetrahydromethanopterin reductase-like flavin-dependent oxidoreductase (luciferase family)
MKFGAIILPDTRWSEGGARWRRAEELGFDHAWTYDHLAWRSLRDSPWMAAVPTLAAAAITTTRIRLGPLVASANFRHPVAFAKELMTLDDISGGRLTVGIGAGAEGWDSTMLGHEAWTTRERTERFAEFVELTDLLLRQPATSVTGRFYSADGARNIPGCIQHPRVPFAIAATGPRGMHLAASYGEMWVTTGDRTRTERLGPREGAGVVRAQMNLLDEACVAAGRDPSSLRRMLVTGPQIEPGMDSVEAFRDAIGCFAEAGVTDCALHWPRSDPPYAGDLTKFEEIVAMR